MYLYPKIPKRCPKCGRKPLFGSAFGTVRHVSSASTFAPETTERLTATCQSCEFRINAFTHDDQARDRGGHDVEEAPELLRPPSVFDDQRMHMDALERALRGVDQQISANYPESRP